MLRTRPDFQGLDVSCEGRSCASIYCSIKWDLFRIRQLFSSVTLCLILLLTPDETLQPDWGPLMSFCHVGKTGEKKPSGFRYTFITTNGTLGDAARM